MSKLVSSIRPRVVVLGSAGCLFLLWVFTHLGQLAATQNGTIRFFLTAFFGLMILLRPKSARERARAAALLPAWASALLVVAAAAMAVLGMMFYVHQVEWLGLLLLLYACLNWALPPRFARDLPLALLLIYWAHPLPSQLFGPLQLAMQRWSVAGSEWLLHLFNVRAWGDGLVLRTAQTVCEVPAWCSGMRTATTVFLLALGLGILRRLRPLPCLLLVAASLAQALVLNVIRIAGVALLTPKLAGLTTADSLHATMGVVVVAGALLVYAELSLLVWLRRRRRARAAPPEYEHDRAITGQPPFWRSLAVHGRLLAGIALLVLAAGALAWKSRPYHRMRMIGDLALELADSGRYDEAQRAVARVREYWPHDLEWRLLHVRLLLAQHRYKRVLGALDDLPEGDIMQRVQQDVLRAYSLMGLDRLDEAAAIVNALPTRTQRSDPRAAMILAEMAFHADQPEAVASHIVTASRWLPNTRRIRTLYPYLRTYRQWESIAASDDQRPYEIPTEALSVTEAYMNLNNTPAVADMTLRAVERWPGDPRLLEPLFFLALKYTREEWEQGFSEHLARCARAANAAEQVYPWFEKCFALARPDLAWLLINRIEEIDPDSPVLPLVVARFGHRWFRFRNHYLGFGAPRPTETMSILPLITVGSCLRLWAADVERIPLGAELRAEDGVEIRRRHLREAVDRFETRAREGRLSLPMHYEYVHALEMSGDLPAARRVLEELAAAHPAEEEAARLRLSEIYARAADWQNVYETLRGYADQRNPAHDGVLRLGEAMRRLRLGLAAVATFRRALELYPDSTRAALALADALAAQDMREEALLVLERPRRWHQREVDVLKARLLFDTQRYTAAETVRRGAMLPRRPLPRDRIQQLFLPPAEIALLWHRVALPSRRQFERHAALARHNLAETTSPFLRALLRAWLEAFEADCAGDTASVRTWAALGRDPLERATALNQLTLLLCHARNVERARFAAEEAAAALPDAPLLWRILIGLSEADQRLMRRARSACPEAGEIWLADLVARTRPAEGEPPREPADGIETALCADLNAWEDKGGAPFSPAVMTRAGEYLLRIGMPRAATLAARSGSRRAQTLLPAHVLAVKCALLDGDRDWALRETQAAIRSSLAPPPLFYKKLVELKTVDGELQIDPEIIEALRNLRQQEPRNPLWAEMLGYIRFRRGGWEIVDALAQMLEAIQHGSTSRRAFVIAAESARLLENYERAADLLRDALEHYPGDPQLRNNLAFVLAQREDTVPEAVAISEELAAALDRLPILDTAAVANIRAGRTARAHELLATILARAEAGTDAAFRARMHQADLALRANRPDAAAEILTAALQDAEQVADANVLQANDLLVRARAVLRRREAAGRSRPAETATPRDPDDAAGGASARPTTPNPAASRPATAPES